jgi:hypothetical protein
MQVLHSHPSVISYIPLSTITKYLEIFTPAIYGRNLYTFLQLRDQVSFPSETLTSANTVFQLWFILPTVWGKVLPGYTHWTKENVDSTIQLTLNFFKPTRNQIQKCNALHRLAVPTLISHLTAVCCSGKGFWKNILPETLEKSGHVSSIYIYIYILLTCPDFYIIIKSKVKLSL